MTAFLVIIILLNHLISNNAECFWSSDFECSNGNCIWNGYVCDGEDHCDDNSDEVNCFEPTPQPTPEPTDVNECYSDDYDSMYSSCWNQCTSYYGSCTKTNHDTVIINGDYSSICECCNCVEDTADTDSDTPSNGDNSRNDETNNGCHTTESGAVANPLQAHSEVVYIFILLFWILCVVPLWLCAFKCRVKETNANDYGWINKFIDIMDENGRKRGFCKYLRYQHSIFKLCCGAMRNRLLVWSSFGFDNVLVFSLSILFASISASVHSESCYYQSGGTISQSITTSGDGGDFEYNYTDTLIILCIKYIYGFFIGRIADFEFRKNKINTICFMLMIFISVLFLIVTIVIRNSYDFGWNMNSYWTVFFASQLQDVFYEMFEIYGKYLIGKCCVNGSMLQIEKTLTNVIESNKTNDDGNIDEVQTVVCAQVISPQPVQPIIVVTQAPVVEMVKDNVLIETEVFAGSKAVGVKETDTQHHIESRHGQNVQIVTSWDKQKKVDVLPLPQGWSKLYSDSGKVYYQNEQTMVTQWVHPLEKNSGWMRRYANDGKIYYQNELTKETQWEKPNEYTE